MLASEEEEEPKEKEGPFGPSALFFFLPTHSFLWRRPLPPFLFSLPSLGKGWRVGLYVCVCEV